MAVQLLHPVKTIISFEVPGRIVEMSINEGNQVSAGQVLAKLEASEYSLQVSQTVTDVEKAKVEYQQTKEDVAVKQDKDPPLGNDSILLTGCKPWSNL